jgi:hypothetical protein
MTFSELAFAEELIGVGAEVEAAEISGQFQSGCRFR